MTRPRRPQHSYLTDTERQQLDVLVRRAARQLPAAECNRLLGLFQHHLGDLQHARATAAGLRRDVNVRGQQRDTAREEQDRLANLLRAAEDELARHRQAVSTLHLREIA